MFIIIHTSQQLYRVGVPVNRLVRRVLSVTIRDARDFAIDVLTPRTTPLVTPGMIPELHIKTYEIIFPLSFYSIRSFFLIVIDSL